MPLEKDVLPFNLELHYATSSEDSILETSDGWNEVPLEVVAPVLLSASQMFRRDAPACLRGTITPETFFASLRAFSVLAADRASR